MRSLLLVAVSCCLALMLAACGRARASAPSLSTGPAPSTTAAAAPAASKSATDSGCGQAHKPGGSDEKLVSDGLERTYRLYVPKGYDPSKPAPLVLNFHGLGGNARRAEVYTGMTRKADAAGFVTVAPDGTGSPQAWHLVTADGQTDDYAFVSRLIDTVSASLCIDQSRIYATGISDGGFFTSLLACQLNDRIAAVAPIAGEPFYAPACSGKEPMPLVAFHGTADPLVSFDGGMVGQLFRIPIRGARDSVAAWAKFNGCGDTATENRIASDVVEESYSDCRNGADTELYVIEGGGHTWPGAPVARGFGNTTQSIRATDVIWDFFATHPRR